MVQMSIQYSLMRSIMKVLASLIVHGLGLALVMGQVWSLPEFGLDTQEVVVQREIGELVHSGRLSEARWFSLQCLAENSGSGNDKYFRKILSSAFVESFRQATKANGETGYLEEVQESLHTGENTSRSKRVVAAKKDLPTCIPAVPLSSGDPTQAWDECCSILPQHKMEWDVAIENSGCIIMDPCCEFFVGSSSHLRLPALHEPATAMRIEVGIRFGENKYKSVSRRLELEQDGYLRPFDVSGIQWPTGYLMSQCVSNPIACGIGDLIDGALRHTERTSSTIPSAIELGSGIGAASISLSFYLQQRQAEGNPGHASPRVVATDIAANALALTTANAWHNGANVFLGIMNHTNTTSVEDVKRRYFPTDSASSPRSQQPAGFAIVMGSSLQSFFQDSHNPDATLWKTIDTLLDNRNPRAIALLVHTRTDPLHSPSDGSFELVRQVSGDRFEMQTRTGDTSDFEIFVFQRPSADETARRNNLENEL